jgi:hypothetical protein
MPTPQITALSNALADCNAAGGTIRSWFVEAKFVTAVAVTADVITGFTMTTTGKWKRWDYALDNTAKYTQTVNRSGNRRTIGQSMNCRFNGVDATINKAAADAMGTCDIIAIHVLPNGVRLVQGLELDPGATGLYILNAGGERTLIQPTVDTDVATGESSIAFLISGTANNVSPTTTITDAALAAL